MEQIIVSVASLLLLTIGLLQAYQKNIEKGDEKVDGLRDVVYNQRLKYLHLKEKYDILVMKYNTLKNSYENLLTRHKKLILQMKNKRDVSNGQK